MPSLKPILGSIAYLAVTFVMFWLVCTIERRDRRKGQKPRHNIDERGLWQVDISLRLHIALTGVALTLCAGAGMLGYFGVIR